MRRSSDRAIIAGAVVLALAGSACAEPADGDATTSPGLDVEARLVLVHPKFRFRDGTRALRGTSLRSQEVGIPPMELGAGAAVTLTLLGTERLRLGGSLLELEGAQRLDDEERYGGLVLPFGTRVESSVRLSSVGLIYVHRFEVAGWLFLDAGLGVEVTTFSSRLRPGGGMTLTGFTPVAHAALGIRPRDWLTLEVRATGLEVPIPLGVLDVSDQLELTARATVGVGRFTLGVELEMRHLHLEERAGRPAQDSFHLRMRGGSFVVGVTF